jgi:hypothetical protein
MLMGAEEREEGCSNSNEPAGDKREGAEGRLGSPLPQYFWKQSCRHGVNPPRKAHPTSKFQRIQEHHLPRLIAITVARLLTFSLKTKQDPSARYS